MMNEQLNILYKKFSQQYKFMRYVRLFSYENYMNIFDDIQNIFSMNSTHLHVVHMIYMASIDMLNIQQWRIQQRSYRQYLLH